MTRAPFKLPVDHDSFLKKALPILQADPRIIGVAGAGSMITGTMDEYSDLDLVVVSSDDQRAIVADERRKVVERLGKLLAAFTGEHVGESRLLICLYDEPLLHVDVKFIGLEEFANRIENPVILWERADALGSQIRKHPPAHPMPDPQWIEDRFWIWVHYAATKVGRGELFETLDFLSYIRGFVLGPLSLVQHGELPRGVRRLETSIPNHLSAMKDTVASYDRNSCIEAVRATISLYRELRESFPPTIERRIAAETASVRYFEQVSRT